MPVRPARSAAAFILVAPLASLLHAQGVEYAPAAGKYRLTSSTKVTQVAFGNSNSFELGVNQLITVNVAKKTRDTLTATLTLDSIAMSPAQPNNEIAKLQGMAFTAWLSPTGKLYSSKGPDGVDPAFAQITDGIVKFFPQYRAGLGLGSTWTDTTSGKVNQQGLDVDRMVVSAYRVAGDTTINAQKALRVERTSTVKATGSGQMAGQSVSMESTGKSSGAFYITPKGVYLGAVSTDDVDVKITLLAQNADVTIRQSGTTKVEAIR